MFAGVLLAGLGGTPAVAASPWWHVSSGSRPSVLPQGGEGTVVVQAVNAGDSATSGGVTVTDTLPAGVAAQSVHFYAQRFDRLDLGSLPLAPPVCEVQPGRVRCTYPEFFPGLNAYEALEMQIPVHVAANTASGGENRLDISGGEAAGVSFSRPLVTGGATTPFAVDDFELAPEEEGGALDAQAGSHPFQLSSTITLNQNADLERPGRPAGPTDTAPGGPRR